MDSDELARFAKRFRSGDFTALPKQPPKLGLSVLTAARQYKDAFAAAEAARRELVAQALRRLPEPREALAALNYLADSFHLPPFTEDDVAAAGGAS